MMMMMMMMMRLCTEHDASVAYIDDDDDDDPSLPLYHTMPYVCGKVLLASVLDSLVAAVSISLIEVVNVTRREAASRRAQFTNRLHPPQKGFNAPPIRVFPRVISPRLCCHETLTTPEFSPFFP